MKNTLGAVNVPLVCAGQLVTPGDVVVADDDGVVVVPRSSAEAARDAAQAREQRGEQTGLGGGELSLDMYNMRPRLEEAGLVYLDSLSDWEDLQ